MTLPINSRYGTLTVIGHLLAAGRTMHQVRCDCGVEKLLPKSRVSQAKSCGCMTKEILRRARTTHGMAKLQTPTYTTWRSMRLRCALKSRRDYPDYGGRGITVCDRWQEFENFLADMGEKPSGSQLDRINNNGNYEPRNCRWVSPTENANNRRSSRFIELNGERLSLIQWARRTRIPRDTLAFRINSGWPIAEALSRPVERQRNNRSTVE